jgi:hypothetical protein
MPSRYRGPPALGDIVLPILLVPVAFVCASLLPEGYAPVVVRSPIPHPREGVGAVSCYEVVATGNHTDMSRGVVVFPQTLVRVGMALLMGRSVLLALTHPKCIPFPYEDSPTIGSGNPVVIFAASFNPPHLGHLELLKFLALTADKVQPRPESQQSYTTRVEWTQSLHRQLRCIFPPVKTPPNADPTQLG